MSMRVLVTRVDVIEDHPTQPQNSVVSAAALTIVTMKNEDGSFRFKRGELVIVVPENAIVPDELLKRTGFWNDAKNKGGLAGSKGNRVKGRVVDGVPSQALIWHTENIETYDGADLHDTSVSTGRVALVKNHLSQMSVFKPGQDVAEFLGITEYIPAS